MGIRPHGLVEALPGRPLVAVVSPVGPRRLLSYERLPPLSGVPLKPNEPVEPQGVAVRVPQDVVVDLRGLVQVDVGQDVRRVKGEAPDVDAMRRRARL